MSPEIPSPRRCLLTLGLVAAAGCALTPSPACADKAPSKGPGQEKETPAVEDLMREHGVLRRALLVYEEVEPKIRAGGGFDARPLYDAALLFRSFGEDYHERKLEEDHIFPVVRKAGGSAGAYVDVLKAQHDRGREITDYILAVCKDGSIASGQAEPLSRALGRFVLMYQNHTAREDTIVFPAWKTALSQQQIDELGDQFEDIERRQFGKDGYEDAVQRIGRIEAAYGLVDLGQFTAPPPPTA
ncbi:MAG: hemerythrin domain-containing protein [Caulobacteraceae bacterium]|nr:hemerythrin domain-containing protein [Caulobacteraceae bacterium]